ncbi:MAG: LssY C-terminal domain-containing protein [Acidobacteriaceae bacterium]
MLLPLYGAAETLPAGTTLEVRLEQPISSYSTKKGAKISCILITPVEQDGKIVLPLRTTIDGTVVEIRKVGLGFVHETAQVDLVLKQIVLADGRIIPLESRMTQVENARERVDKEGRIDGIRSSSTLGHRTAGIMGTLAFGDPIAAIFANAASSSVLRFSEPEISFPAGTEMTAQLTSAIEVPAEPVKPVPPIADSAAEKTNLGSLVRKLPFRTYTDGSHIPSDLTNLIFIGSAGAIERAFAASGWEPVDELTAQTAYTTVRSIAENQGYRRAPMSTLLLGNEAPRFGYAKTLNTFSKRHHLRVFASQETWRGQPVWSSSSTHDIGIGFSKKNKTFIHLIDTHIDNERAKVVNDLILTGCVTGVQLVERPWVPRDAKNGTGEDLITDGKVAVLELDGCEAPDKESAHDGPVPLQIHGNAADRGVRQTVLTLRNNILRDNVGVMAYSGIRYAVDAKKKKEGPAPTRTMDISGEQYTIQNGFHGNDSFISSSASQPEPGARARSRRAASWAPPSVELGMHSGWAGYAGGNGGAIAYLFQAANMPDRFLLVALGNDFKSGWDIGGSVTLDSQNYFSHEFSYDHSFTTFVVGLAVADNESTSSSQAPLFAFSNVGIETSQVTYDLLINARPKTSRWRPYVAVGPAFQLMHLSEAPIKKAPAYFRLGLSNIGLISAAYNFGSKPPLDGGGIFQIGFNYGGGIRYRVTPRWMLRMDYRETLVSQPDFWSKSREDLLNNITVTDYSLYQEFGPVLQGNMREQHGTIGISFTF